MCISNSVTEHELILLTGEKLPYRDRFVLLEAKKEVRTNTKLH